MSLVWLTLSLGFSLRGVESGALQNDVNIELCPRKILCVGHCIDCDLLAINCDGAGGLDGLAVFLILGLFGSDSVKIFAENAAVTALCRVILQQVCQHLGACQVVDSNDVITLSAEHLTERKTADSAETVDSNFN